MTVEDNNLRFKKIMDSFGLSQKDFGALLGVTQKQISAIIHGHSRITKMLEELLRCKLGINIAWLNEGRGRMFLNKPAHMNACPIINTLPERHEGKAVLNIKSGDVENIYIPGVDGSQNFCVRIQDDSMAPRLHKGDILVIDPSLEFDRGIAVVGIQEQYQVRYVKKEGKDRYAIWSKQSGEAPQKVSADDIVLFVPIMVISIKSL